MIEIQLDSESKAPTVLQTGSGVIRLTLSPAISLDTALELCHDSLVTALQSEFQALFADRDVERDYEIVDKSVIIRRV